MGIRVGRGREDRRLDAAALHPRREVDEQAVASALPEVVGVEQRGDVRRLGTSKRSDRLGVRNAPDHVDEDRAVGALEIGDDTADDVELLAGVTHP